jgi:hypothetical protein
MPVVLIWQVRHQRAIPWKTLLTTGLGLLLVLLIEYRWAGPGALSPYQFLGHRPLEIGSFPGVVAAALDPKHATIRFAFGAMNILTPVNGPVGLAFDVLMAMSIATTLALFYWNQLDFHQASLLVIVILLLTSKVFSVQFIMWMIPLWCYFPLNRYWILASAFSSAGYPVAYLYAAHHPGWWWLVVVLFTLRSLAILAGTWTTLRSHPSTKAKQEFL